MPMYYDVSIPITTATTAANQSSGPHLTVKSGTAVNAKIMQVMAAARGSSAGGGILRAHTLSTATSSSGTTLTPNKRNPNSPSATSSALSSQTGPGSTPAQRIGIGFAVTGSPSGWVAIEPDSAIKLTAGGGANGNIDFNSIAAVASVVADLSVEFAEE